MKKTEKSNGLLSMSWRDVLLVTNTVTLAAAVYVADTVKKQAQQEIRMATTLDLRIRKIRDTFNKDLKAWAMSTDADAEEWREGGPETPLPPAK